jgi:microsomal dipeptidase-like Zn-dependent dipeptidase
VEDADHTNTADIGCATPYLEAGNVKLQIMAVYTSTGPGSAEAALAQIPAFYDLIETGHFHRVQTVQEAEACIDRPGTGMIMAIENASGLCEEDEDLDRVFARLEYFEENAGRLLYVGLTHHLENRFGGGNKTQVGLKPDGMALLDYLDRRGIAIDFSHASDALAYDVLAYIDEKGLDIPVMASHSNFRPVWDHVRNLPLSIAQEIIARKGLIGMNFLREYVNREVPEDLERHILYGIENGGEQAVAFGADYFYIHGLEDKSRDPLFFPEHANASCYIPLLHRLEVMGVSDEQLNNIAYGNFLRFLERIWA